MNERISEEASKDLGRALDAVAVLLSRQVAVMAENLNRPSPLTGFRWK